MMFSDLWPTICTENQRVKNDIAKIKGFVNKVLPVQLALTPDYTKRVINAFVERRISGIEYDGNNDSDVSGTLMAAISTASTLSQDEVTNALLVTKWHYSSYLQNRSTPVLVLTLLFFKYRMQSRQVQLYSQLLTRRILDLQDQGPIDQGSALAAWTLVHIQAEQLSWDMESLISTCRSLPIPDAGYIQSHCGNEVWDLFNVRTLHSLCIADNLVLSEPMPDSFLAYYRSSEDISSLVSLTWHVRHAIPSLQKKCYTREEGDAMGNIVTATLKEYLQRTQKLSKAERRIRFAIEIHALYALRESYQFGYIARDDYVGLVGRAFKFCLAEDLISRGDTLEVCYLKADIIY